MGLHTRLGTALTVGLLLLMLNAYAVINGHWDWSFVPERSLLTDSVAESAPVRPPETAS